MYRSAALPNNNLWKKIQVLFLYISTWHGIGSASSARLVLRKQNGVGTACRCYTPISDIIWCWFQEVIDISVKNQKANMQRLWDACSLCTAWCWKMPNQYNLPSLYCRNFWLLEEKVWPHIYMNLWETADPPGCVYMVGWICHTFTHGRFLHWSLASSVLLCSLQCDDGPYHLPCGMGKSKLSEIFPPCCLAFLPSPPV